MGDDIPAAQLSRAHRGCHGVNASPVDAGIRVLAWGVGTAHDLAAALSGNRLIRGLSSTSDADDAVLPVGLGILYCDRVLCCWVSIICRSDISYGSPRPPGNAFMKRSARCIRNMASIVGFGE